MDQSLSFHFLEGLKHISDINGYDHIVFLIALCAVYDFSEWRKVLLLVTSFTIGHSITLFFAGMDWLGIPSAWAEFLIPCTILLTALYNLKDTKQRRRPRERNGSMAVKYVLALLFGLIHGFGFSNYFRMIRIDEQQSFVADLLLFNLGVEAGQFIIVLILLLISSIFMSLFRFKHAAWTIFTSGMAAGISLILIKETWIW